MPPRHWRERVQDIIEAIRRIESYIADMNAETFAGDRRTIDAVVRNLEILGEA